MLSVALTLGLSVQPGRADTQLRATLVIDAEFGHPTSTSARAIAMGAELAVRDIARDERLSRIKLDIRRTDNRGIAAIGVDNFVDAAKDPSVIAVMGGKFSPVQVTVAASAHAEGLMLLDPWGSADNIIDNGFQPNWAFRLSLKDEWATEAFARTALRSGATMAGVILPNTAWGRSTQAALAKQAGARGLRIVGERWYNWGEASLVQRYLDLVADGAQTIILVANEIEGSILTRELASLPSEQHRPIIAHLGVTGGDFEGLAGDALRKVDLRIVQTFSFYRLRTAKAARFRDEVLAATGRSTVGEIESPIGVAHAYDLTWLLVMAMDAANSTDRARVRDAMEKLGPLEGVTRHYDAPFTEKRHEALSPAEIFFARYQPGRGLVPTDE